MITQDYIEQIESFDSHGAPVLSLYLDLPPERQFNNAYRIVLKDLLKESREGLSKAARRDFEREAERVQTWLGERRPEGRSLMLFTCSARDFWQPTYLSVGNRDHLAFEPKPDLAPLFELMAEYERYAVAVVDKKQAHVYSVFMGEIEAENHSEDFVPAKHDQGGVSQANYLRHHEAHVYRHLKPVVECLTQMSRDRPFDRLVLSGPEEVRDELADLLPKDLARRVVATLPDLPANEAQVLRITLEVEEQVERREENARLDHVLEVAASGGPATAALTETLLALWQRAVHTLLISGDSHDRGAECSNCGRLQSDPNPRCPACNAEMRPVHDLFERAIERAVDQDSEVEVLHGKPARRLQQEAGGMGALLRFRLPAEVL